MLSLIVYGFVNSLSLAFICSSSFFLFFSFKHLQYFDQVCGDHKRVNSSKSQRTQKKDTKEINRLEKY